jgi:energy-coupling factor transporter ATP-binding protein EcfA2
MSDYKVVVISGKMGAGKSTLSRILKSYVPEKYRVIEVKFAGVLYEMHDALLTILNKYDIQRNIVKDGTLLQLLGTEWGRNTIDQNIWVNTTKAKIKALAEASLKERPDKIPLFVIDDCRFKNEFDTMPEALRIRLQCPRVIRRLRCTAWRDNEDHPSETDLDTYVGQNKFDLVFETDKMIPETQVEIISKTLEVGTWKAKRLVEATPKPKKVKK